jgi:hypothetical protein
LAGTCQGSTYNCSGFINETKFNPDLEISASGLLKKARKDAVKRGAKSIVAPQKLAYTACDITARLTLLLSELSELNGFTKQLKFAALDEPSKDEVRALITLLRKISKDSADRADRLQAAAA